MKIQSAYVGISKLQESWMQAMIITPVKWHWKALGTLHSKWTYFSRLVAVSSLVAFCSQNLECLQPQPLDLTAGINHVGAKHKFWKTTGHKSAAPCSSGLEGPKAVSPSQTVLLFSRYVTTGYIRSGAGFKIYHRFWPTLAIWQDGRTSRRASTIHSIICWKAQGYFMCERTFNISSPLLILRTEQSRVEDAPATNTALGFREDAFVFLLMSSATVLPPVFPGALWSPDYDSRGGNRRVPLLLMGQMVPSESNLARRQDVAPKGPV